MPLFAVFSVILHLTKFLDMFNSNSSGGFRAQWPPVTKNLIIINVIIYAVELINPGGFTHTLLSRLGLHFFESSIFNPAQPVTYMFLHDPNTILHILFNMFTLWMFGRFLENVWGSRRFLIFYMVCGVGAALVQEIVWAFTWEHDYVAAIAASNGLTFEHARQWVEQALASGDADVAESIRIMKNSMLTIGASGAIFGLLLGFAFVFPNMPLYLFFIPVPIKAKYMVIGYAVLEFFFGVTGRVASVAHFAHLGGMIFGLILLLYWRKKGTLRGNWF